jgi:cytidylate kinase
MSDKNMGDIINKRGFIVAIDGPGGVGKSTVSRRIAEKLGGKYVDTGAMYRAFALAMQAAGVKSDNEGAVKKFCGEAEIVYRTDSGSIFVNGIDYSDKIRSEEAGALASRVASKGIVRRTLVAYQRAFRYEGFLVIEGRDMGTVVFPDADIKIFLDAAPEVRAMRRHGEGSGVGNREETEKVLKRRDKQDRERADSPLARADDAIALDTTNLDIDEVISTIMAHIEKRLSASDSKDNEKQKKSGK